MRPCRLDGLREGHGAARVRPAAGRPLTVTARVACDAGAAPGVTFPAEPRRLGSLDAAGATAQRLAAVGTGAHPATCRGADAGSRAERDTDAAARRSGPLGAQPSVRGYPAATAAHVAPPSRTRLKIP